VTSFQGKYYTLTDAVCEPKPIQNPIPIIIGGLGEQLTLRIVAEFADIWNVYVMLEPEEYQHKLDLLSQYCQEIGRDPADIRRSMIIFAVVGETEREAREQALQRRFRPDGWLAGTPEQLVESLLARVKQGVSDFLLYTPPPIDWRSIDLIATKVAPIVRSEGARLLNAASS
jgi:alkanesulfonate monooxygenase SsuD/methylene tetrahydromethanopterin reductase-like flavin-dependent oxidoreductase (luciferase family)